MDGSDNYTAIDIGITNANHTGVSNTIQALNVVAITEDADATETAIMIGNGWDVGIDAGNNSIVTTGNITGAIITGSSIVTTGSLDAGAILSTSTITSNATGSLGWSIVAGANTACNTTCTFACVHGWETTAGEVAVDCADATADKCLCAGAN